MTTGTQFQAKNQREAILVLARTVDSFKDKVATDCDTIDKRLQNIEGHLLTQQDKVDKNCNRITRLETIVGIFGGAVPIVLGIITKLHDTWPWR